LTERQFLITRLFLLPSPRTVPCYHWYLTDVNGRTRTCAAFKLDSSDEKSKCIQLGRH
jgi:hypothetical protein